MEYAADAVRSSPELVEQNAMSASGPKQTLGPQKATSVDDPKRTFDDRLSKSAFDPKPRSRRGCNSSNPRYLNADLTGSGRGNTPERVGLPGLEVGTRSSEATFAGFRYQETGVRMFSVLSAMGGIKCNAW